MAIPLKRGTKGEEAPSEAAREDACASERARRPSPRASCRPQLGAHGSALSFLAPRLRCTGLLGVLVIVLVPAVRVTNYSSSFYVPRKTPPACVLRGENPPGGRAAGFYTAAPGRPALPGARHDEW